VKNEPTGRRIFLFGQPYQWERRTTDGGKKAPKRKKGQLLLRRARGLRVSEIRGWPEGAYQPHTMPAWVPPCMERLRAPVVPGYVETGMVERS
jgi:hypothetical protein